MLVTVMHLTGTINGIENFTKISYLYLGTNQFRGQIPSGLSDLTNLTSLVLSENKLTGEIPSSIGNLTNVRRLFLNNNQLSGEIPNTFTDFNFSLSTHFDLRYNCITSIPQQTYNGISSYVNLSNQSNVENLEDVGLINEDFQLTGLQAYEQFPNYGIPFVYTLHLPDGTTSIIQPTIANGAVKIAGSELTQSGKYSLVANGNGASFVYTTNFALSENISYIGASANGEADKVTSTKITIDLSAVPEAGELGIDDISLNSVTKALPAINKDSITSLGNGKYELTISGTWNEGSTIDVALSKEDVVFSPSSHSVTLHAQATDTDKSESVNTEDTSNNDGDNNPSIQTSYNNSSMILIFVIGLLISGGYLITKRKKQ